MGLASNRAEGSGPRKTFSKDVLQLEIYGPDKAHLSIIDVSGIFRTTTTGVTKYRIQRARVAVLLKAVCSNLWKPMSVSALIASCDGLASFVEYASRAIRVSGPDPDPGRHLRRRSSSNPSNGSVAIGGDALLSAAVVSHDGLFPRRGVEEPARLLGGLKVLELPEDSGRAFEPTVNALSPGSKSSVFRG
jgi:hypothetical protein